jgi:hypothetical protein
MSYFAGNGGRNKEGNSMEFTRETVNKWLENYFRAFHTNQGSVDSVQKMRQYFTPELEFWPFNMAPGSVPRPSSLDDLLRSMVHPGLHEQITPLDWVLDESKKAVAVFAQIQFTDEASKTTWPARYAGAFMYFTHDANQDLKVNKIRYFLENRPAGETTYRGLWDKYRDQEFAKKK